MATQKGAISFGLVYIPVSLYTATQDNDFHFNQLAKNKDGKLVRVRYVKTCDGCKKELTPKDIVKGFQYEKDKYVVVTDDDFEKIKTDKDRAIQILKFVPAGSIPPYYFNRSYHVTSENGGQKPFELLRQAMLKENKVAIGKTVLGQKETIVAIMPDDKGMIAETLHFAEEIKDMPVETVRPVINKDELDMAEKLIESMSGDFDLTGIKNEYQEKLNKLIEAKISGQEIVQPESTEKPNNIINLMDALKASIEQSEKGKKKQSAIKRTKKTGS